MASSNNTKPTHEEINSLHQGEEEDGSSYRQRSSMTVSERLDLPIALASIPFVALFAILTGPFRARKQRLNPKQTIARSLLLHVGYSIFRRVVSRFSPLQVQAIVPSTTTEYKLYAWKYGVPQRSVDLGEGATGHWVGNPDAKNVLIWMHGGGFAVPANRGYFIFFDKFLKEMRSANKDISVFVIAYTLAPKAVYPMQLRQCTTALRYILEKTDRKADNIFLGGDSAGANLVLGVLSHIAHPHPEIEPLQFSSPGEQIGGATLLSPWSSLETTFPPQDTEPLGDLIHPGCAKPWAGSYLGGRKRDNYTDARLAPIEWWHNLPIKHVLVTAGGYELLLPYIEDFADRLKEGLDGTDKSGGKVEFFVGEKEAHVAPMFNLMLGDNVETQQGNRVKAFYKEVVH